MKRTKLRSLSCTFCRRALTVWEGVSGREAVICAAEMAERMFSRQLGRVEEEREEVVV